MFPAIATLACLGSFASFAIVTATPYQNANACNLFARGSPHKPPSDDVRLVTRAENWEGCTPEQKSFFEDSYGEAISLAYEAVDYIRKGDPANLFEKYFGPKQESEKNVLEMLSKIAEDAFKGKQFTCEPARSDPMIMYKAGDKLAALEPFFSSPKSDCSGKDYYRGPVIIHEIGHFYGTADIAYGCGDCMKLAPADAVKNADNYRCFTEAVWIAEHCPSNSPSSIPESGS